MIVVDTHVIIWDALKAEKLSRKAKEAILEANEGAGILFCDISLWEIAMLIKKNRLSLQLGYQEFIRLVLASNKYILQPITPEIADLSTRLPDDVNFDPVDRIIAATAIIENAQLVTADKNLRLSTSIPTLW